MSHSERWARHRSNAAYQRAKMSATRPAGGDAARSIHRLNPAGRQGGPILAEPAPRPKTLPQKGSTMERRRTSPHLFLTPYDRQWQTDKVTHGYVPHYLSIVQDLTTTRTNGRSRDFSVLEIGVGDGSGMAMFRDIFGLVHGVDSDERRANHVGALHANQTDPDLWERLITHYGADLGPAIIDDSVQFDVIVDDASHDPGATAITLRTLWPAVALGGYYVIEDWNHIDGLGMWSNLWQSLFGHVLTQHNRNRSSALSGVLEDIDQVSVLDGLIVLAKSQ